MTDAEAVREALDDSMRCHGDDECRCSGHSAYRALDRIVARIAELEKRIENVACFGDETCMCNDCYFINRHRP